MFLRLILVSLVTSMGLELPSDRDVACFNESVSAWANANIRHLAGPETAATTPAETDAVEVCDPAPADVTFESVQAEIAAEFVAESLVVADETPTTYASCGEPEVVTLTEVITIGLPDGEELATIVTVAEVPVELVSIANNDSDSEVDADLDLADDALEVEADAPAPADQVAAAVRLTREAAQAWACLFQQAADEVDCTR